MVQFIPQYSRSAGLGQATGEALSSALHQMAQKKAARMQKQQQAQALQELGLPASLSALEPQVQSQAFKQRGEQQKLASLMELLGGAEPSAIGEETVVESTPKGFTDEQILATSLIDPQLARTLQAQKGQQLQERKFKQGSKEQAFKLTKDTRKEITKGAKGARENLARLGRMEKLVNEGKLTNPVYNQILKGIGLDVPILKNASSQEFDKLTVDFLRGAREIFGARVTNFEVENFLKAIPSLSQSEGGKRRVIRNLELMNQGAEVRSDVMREIIKENGGIPPLDLEEKIEERAAPKLDELSSQFLSGDVQDKAPRGVTISADEVIMIDPSGARRKVSKKDVKAAKAEGYKLG